MSTEETTAAIDIPNQENSIKEDEVEIVDGHPNASIVKYLVVALSVLAVMSLAIATFCYFNKRRVKNKKPNTRGQLPYYHHTSSSSIGWAEEPTFHMPHDRKHLSKALGDVENRIANQLKVKTKTKNTQNNYTHRRGSSFSIVEWPSSFVNSEGLNDSNVIPLPSDSRIKLPERASVINIHDHYEADATAALHRHQKRNPQPPSSMAFTNCNYIQDTEDFDDIVPEVGDFTMVDDVFMLKENLSSSFSATSIVRLIQRRSKKL